MDKMIVSNDSFSVLKSLYSNNILSSDAPISQVRQLAENDLIKCPAIATKGGYFMWQLEVPVEAVKITEKGKAYVEWREREIESKERQLLSLEEMSASFKRQIEEAESEAKAATFRSWIAIGISAAAFFFEIFMRACL